MNSEFSISKANLESCLHDNWLVGMTPPQGYDVDEVYLDVPEAIKLKVTYKPKEVAH